MLALPISLAAPVAWLASDRLLLGEFGSAHEFNLAHGAGSEQARDQAWQRALLDYQACMGTRIRREDAQAAIKHSKMALDTLEGHYTAIHQKSLQHLSQQFLYWQGQCFEVRPTRLQEWLTLASVLDVSWIIAQAYCHELRAGRLSVSEALHAMLQMQCVVALPKSREFEQYADNHVHFNGHGSTNVSMLDIALRIIPPAVPSNDAFSALTSLTSLTPSQQKQLDNWPHRPEYTVFESAPLSKLTLVKLVRCLGARSGVEALSGAAHTVPEVTLQQLDLIQPAGLTEWLTDANIAVKPYRQLLFHAQKTHLQSRQGWLAWCCGLLWCSASKPLSSAAIHPTNNFNQQLLGFIRASNVLRNYMVVSATGLGQFVRFFGFEHRRSGGGGDNFDFDANRDSANHDSANQDSATQSEANIHREFRISPDKVVTRQQHKKNAKQPAGYRLQPIAFEKLVKQLKHSYPADNLHFVLHFVREFPKHQPPAQHHPLWQAFRQQLLQQVQKLQAFHASVTYSDRSGAALDSPPVSELAAVDLRKLVRGYDVAGNENALPIEVFASALRVLRAGKQISMGELSKRLPNPFLTVHCGEDFNHILTGLRAIDETVNFCDYQPGDRLGHALALGLDVAAWAERQQTIYLTVQQHLDNLVWCHHQALQICQHVAQFNNIVAVLAQKIDYWANYLGLGDYSRNDLYQAWQLRRNCPQALEIGAKSTPSVYRDWLPDLTLLNSTEGTSARAVWERYLRPKALDHHSKADEIVAISCQPHVETCLAGYTKPLQDTISTAELTLYSAIQDYLMEKYSAKGVIIEACPTSNIYIGRFEAYHQHPIYRWHPPDLTWLNQGERFNQFGLRKGAVNVCLNTDDSALMPTTIANEHRVMRDVAVQHYQVGSHAADDWIKRIREFGMTVFKKNHLP